LIKKAVKQNDLQVISRERPRSITVRQAQKKRLLKGQAEGLGRTADRES
jgi:hypothetical protein